MVDSTPSAGRIIRSPAEVDAAVGCIPRTMPLWQGEEGPRWRITISPGSIQIGTKDYAKANAAAERALRRRIVETDLMAIRARRPAMPTRGRIVDWSRKSRARMVRRLCTLDYTPLFERGTPALVTLTLPHDWQAVAPTAEAFKDAVNRFRSSWRRAWGEHAAGVWKMEFQYRRDCANGACRLGPNHDPRAPHFHLLTALPEGRTKRYGYDFHTWLSQAWTKALRIPDAEERRLHLAAGTGVDIEETLRYGDAKRIAVYFTKHGAFASKDYQNVMPESWRAAEEGGAHFWGYWGLRPAEGVVETDPEIAAWVARHLRHLNDAEGRVREEDVWRSKPLPADLDQRLEALQGDVDALLSELLIIGERSVVHGDQPRERGGVRPDSSGEAALGS